MKILTQTERVDAGALLAKPVAIRLADRLTDRKLLTLFTLVSLVPLSLVGCSASLIPSTLMSSTPKPQVEVEYVDRQTVVVEEVSQYPKSFSTNQSVSSLWKKVKLLSGNYINTASKPSVLRKPSSSGFHVRHLPTSSTVAKLKLKNESHSKDPKASRYGYEIVAHRLPGGVLSVRVSAVDLITKRRNDESDLVARNLARFLKTGTLERNLL